MMTEEEFAEKVAWEGGVMDALDYGLSADALEDRDSELASAWARLEDQRVYVRDTIEEVESLLNEILEGAEDV